MPTPMILIWCAVVLYLLWVQVLAAFSEPPVPVAETVMPSLMAVLAGAGLSAMECLGAGGWS